MASKIDRELCSSNICGVNDHFRCSQVNEDLNRCLQEAVDEGMQSGDGGILDMRAVKRKARRLACWGGHINHRVLGTW